MTLKSRTSKTMIGLALAIVAVSAARAQTTTTTTVAATTPAAAKNLRFFNQFIADPAIVDRQWYGIELRYQSGAVPPIQEADGILLTPTIAISPMKNLEIGGTVSWIDFDLDHDVQTGRTEQFSGESGVGDLTAWGKYRFVQGNVSVAAGGLLVLPTGSEDDGLGTGELIPGVFGGVRIAAGPGFIVGDLTVMFNSDAEILGETIEANTSTTVGGGYMWHPYQEWAFSGEVTIASERFDSTDSDFRVTAGAQYVGYSHSILRGMLGIGLSDGAPDLEVAFGYAYTF